MLIYKQKKDLRCLEGENEEGGGEVESRLLELGEDAAEP
jgi:hypothetical protein